MCNHSTNIEVKNLKAKKQLSKYYSQLVTEGTVQSLLFGLSIGFFVGFIIFIFGIITTKNLLWLGLIISFSVALISGLLMYLLPFKPTIKKVAKRIDALGLEERTITMVELEQNESFIAQVQRENTQEVLSKSPLKLLSFSVFIKPLIIFAIITASMVTSISFMISKVNAAGQIVDPPVIDNPTDDEIFQEMIDDLLSIINNAQIDVGLKSTLYQMVLDLERRLPTYDTYLEKYVDVLQTRNEILQLIADAIIEIEESLMNIAEALQQYENTEVLGIAIATWNDDEIIAAFGYMYDRIDVLLGQELYDVMWQTAFDIEAALAEAVGTDPGMHQALQDLADAYKLALENFQEGRESEILDEFEQDMQESLESLLEAIQDLRDLIEELLELEEEIEEEIDEVDEFPIFMPYPEDSGEGTDPGDPNTTSENNVIDGQTPYESIYDSYYQYAMEWLTDDNLSDEMRKIIEDYFNMLS